MSGKLAFAVVLSGAGMKDGSEIHESVSALLAISNAGGEYQCFAPDITFDEVNYLTGAPTGAKRRVMLEAARIARGNIKDLINVFSIGKIFCDDVFLRCARAARGG